MNDYQQKPYEDLPEFLGCTGLFILELIKVCSKIFLLFGTGYLLCYHITSGIFALVIATSLWILFGDYNERKT